MVHLDLNFFQIINRAQCLLLEVFNTRELANLTWVLIAICIAMFVPRIRSSIFDVLKSLFTWDFVIIYVIVFVYIRFIVIQLEQIGVWDLSLLKDTIYWAVLTGLTLMFNIGTSKDPLGYLKTVFKTSIQFSVVIQFIANLETFSFRLEFTVIPIIILFSGIYAVSEHRQDHASVKKLLGNLGTTLSIIAFGYLIYFVVMNYEKYSNIETGKQFLLPIILTISFMPILAILNLVVQYEDISSLLKRRARSNKQYYYMLFSSLLYFSFDIKGLIRWFGSLTATDLENNKAIKASMKRISFKQKQEKIPPEYPEFEGWLPKYAKSFLIDLDLEITNYDSELDNLWKGSSKIKLDEDFMTGDCAYSIHGTKYVVERLGLHFRAFDPTRTQDLTKFVNIVDALYNRSLYKGVPHKIRSSILNLGNLEYKDELGDISVHINRWKNERRGYDLYIGIKHWGSVKTDNFV